MQKADRAPSSPAFDWLMGVLVFLVMAGVFQDGWAHTHGLVDQSFFTPWHAVLYGGAALTGLMLLAAGVTGLRKGYSLANALPHGYWFAAWGAVLFLIGGGLDELWHNHFGIEVDLQALVSPTHLLLVLAGGLMISGPLRSIARQYDRQAGGWKAVGPAVFATLAALMMLEFFTQYALPLGDGAVYANITHGASAHQPGSIYRFTVAIGQMRRITTGIDAYGASASPDGKRIVYRVYRPSSAASDIIVANANGSHPRAITNSGRHDTQPAWSPNGEWIAYISAPAGTAGSFHLNVVHPDGSAERTLTDETAKILGLSWSRDSASIAYGSRNAVTREIALVNVATKASTWIVTTAGGWNPSLGPQGLIAFQRSDGVYVTPGFVPMPNDFPEVLPHRWLPYMIDQASDPSFSPDGQLAYIKSDGDAAQIYVRPWNVAPARNVSQLSGLDAQHPVWANGSVYATVRGRVKPEFSFMGNTHSEASFLLQSVLVSGLLLLLIRRWRAPIGSITLILTVSSLALSFQSDQQPLVWSAVFAGIVGDALVFAFHERVRTGNGSYAFGAIVPSVLAAAYLALLAARTGPLGWHLDLVFGTPVLAAAAGLIVAFCYEPPLPD